MRERPSLQNLQAALQQGEGEFWFKRRFTSESQIARTLVAFANGDGGLLLFGISETPEGAEVAGLSRAEAEATIERVRRLAASVVPAPVPVGVIEVEGKPVVYASVNPVPPHLKPITTATGDVYERQINRDVRVERHPGPVRCHPRLRRSGRL
jgi:predicted HTH transcriptional regulator